MGTISPHRKGRSGRKRKTTLKYDGVLRRLSKINPRKNSFELQKNLELPGVKSHDSTLRRRLLECDRKSRRPL